MIRSTRRTPVLMTAWTALAAAAVAVAVLPAAVSAAPITTGSLVREMIDMHRLAEVPDPMFETVQFSSYDHRSTLPGGPHWFANADGFGREPVPNFEAVLTEPDENGVGTYLICDVRGPGAIVRTWTAAIEGTIRLTLDGAEKPIYDGPANEFLFQPWRRFAEAAGLEPDLFADTFYQRNAAYCPIPFAKRCRIEWTGNVQRIHFYQIQIRRYAPDAEVVTFTPDDLKTHRQVVRDVARVLADPDGQWIHRSSAMPLPFAATVAPGQTRDLIALEGAQAIERLTLEVTADDLDRALRQTVLHVVCDDYPWGQVQAPIGDFFGAAPGINPFNAVPFTVRPDSTMVCRYVQPFARSLKIVVDNRSTQNVTVEGSALLTDYTWNDDRSMHFRARWRVDHGLIADNRPPQDLPYLIAHGMGTFVGAATFLLNPNNVPFPGGSWWGEGDEKIFVDDDVRPSTFGTGSEDYYNYAWSTPDIFVQPYAGQPRNDGPANRGFVTNHRFHVLDPLPFTHRLSFYMELFSHERTPGLSYARIAYHYAKPGLMDDHVPITTEDVRPLELPPNWQPAARRGAANSVFHQVEDQLVGHPRVAFVQDNLWSGGKLMVWQPARKGDRLEIRVPIAEAGNYLLRIVTRRDAAAGKVALNLDGKPIGFGDENAVVDLNAPHRTLSRAITAKPAKLDQGDHTLTLRYEAPPPGHDIAAIGLDFLWIQKK